jgi:hypothetical protein
MKKHVFIICVCFSCCTTTFAQSFDVGAIVSECVALMGKPLPPGFISLGDQKYTKNGKIVANTGYNIKNGEYDKSKMVVNWAFYAA